MEIFRVRAICLLIPALVVPAQPRAGRCPASIPIDRDWEVLADPAGEARAKRRLLRAAGRRLGDWGFELTNVPVDQATLRALGQTPISEPLVRAAREQLGQAVDLDDFLLFLDDLLVAGKAGARGCPVVVPSGRARSAGILLHPQDVFRQGEPREYAGRRAALLISEPAEPRELAPAADGAPLGPRWTARYRQPVTEAGRLELLGRHSPSGSFQQRVESLISQLRAQGAWVEVQSTVRDRRRGYLIYGCFILARATTEAEVAARVARLDRCNAEWGLNVPIRWAHPDGWEATQRAARRMAETYDVVYATEHGARHSDHYDGVAVDLIAFKLPRSLTLEAQDGATATFDLSAGYQSRDLSLTIPLIDWVEAHFQLHKLRRDYPHWTDAAPPASAAEEDGRNVARP